MWVRVSIDRSNQSERSCWRIASTSNRQAARISLRAKFEAEVGNGDRFGYLDQFADWLGLTTDFFMWDNWYHDVFCYCAPWCFAGNVAQWLSQSNNQCVNIHIIICILLLDHVTDMYIACVQSLNITIYHTITVTLCFFNFEENLHEWGLIR